eukprot:gene11765-12837_t
MQLKNEELEKLTERINFLTVLSSKNSWEDFQVVSDAAKGAPVRVKIVPAPTIEPTEAPSEEPSEEPTEEPTNIPSGQPSNVPSSVPSTIPTSVPS